MRSISVLQRVDLGLGRRLGCRVVATGVGGLDRQVTHAVEHGVHLVQRTFSGLHDRDAVLGVAGGLLQAADLGTQALADDEAGGVVGRPVDAEARGELLEVLAQLDVRAGQVA